MIVRYRYIDDIMIECSNERIIKGGEHMDGVPRCCLYQKGNILKAGSSFMCDSLRTVC